MRKLQNRIKTEQELRDIMEVVLREYYRKAISDNIKRALKYKKLSTQRRLAM